MRLMELAPARVRYGYRWLHILLRRGGWKVNHKRTCWIYRDEGLSIRVNGRLRAECLNASWFLSPADAPERIEEWSCHYSKDRPHTALGGLTPQAFANQAVTARELA